MKTRLTHVRANVYDLQRSIDWYEAVLGFECTGADINDRWQYADFACGEGATFAIAVDEHVPSFGRFNFDVDDVDALWARIKGRAEVLQPIETMPYGTRKFTISDLDGNALGFVQQNFGR